MSTSERTILASRLSDARRESFHRLLAPRHIAFVGGRQVEGTLRNISRHKFEGEVYVVNPGRSEIAGYKCYRNLADLPVAPDATYLGVNADITVKAVGELNRMGAGGVICYASGFSEIGEAGAERNRLLIEASGEMAVVGPNCYGLVNYVTHGSMWPSGYQPLSTKRGAAVIGQSGNVCIHLTSNQRSVPFSYLISAGNQAILGFEDYIDYLVDDPNVSSIGLFMEGIRDIEGFSQACLRARAKGMPVIVCRSGRSELGAAMAASHTSSLAGQNEYYDALFARLGVIATDTVPQFLEMLKIASVAPSLAGKRIAVFSSSGGDNGLAADYCSFAGLELPQPTKAQIDVIKPLLPDFGHVSNPLDFTAGYWGNEELLTPMFTTMLEGGYDSGLMVMDHPSPKVSEDSSEPILAMIRALAAAGRASGKAVFMGSVNPESIPEGVREWMLGQGVVPLQGLHDAAKVIALWAEHCERLRRDAASGHGLAGLALLHAAPLVGGNRTINENESKRRLAAHGLPVPDGRVLARAEIDALPEMLDAPIVLKVLHDELAHKTEVGGVALNLRSRAEIRAAADRMAKSVRRHAPGVVLEKFLMEPMQAPPLAELIVGVKRDPLFGMVLVVGAGGIFVELLKDARPLLLPVSRGDVEAALRGLKTFPLLDGFRGKPRANLEPVIDAIMAIAGYAETAVGTLSELDVNPLMVYENGAVAVDALIVEA
ncbi:acetate--CoA ligase family protein [Rhizobium sp. TH2]|uniref:acetate--CoA ligase family protein n=1 Tax=Rhizobium sp. TH2 TaxID=2775403 RepID=UPI0021584EAD|nr:acetate--CoA ligase family protein [Rhizobium sp. TH2]UVC10545.1 acetate--CoA ligase family protein [Rhizobium sp. TH2]